MSKYEYIELDLHGETGTETDTKDSPRGEGPAGYIAKLNKYGAQGWRVINIDIDTHSHVRVIMEREETAGG